MFDRARSDQGFALAAVMGVISLLTVLAFGGYFLAQNALNDSTRVAAESRAFQVAESGLDRELAVFNPSSVGSSYFPRYGTTPDGNYTVSVTEINSGSIMGEYLLTSVGSSLNASETVSMRFFYLDLWKMNLSAGDPTTLGGGSGWNGSASITGPMYVRGDFEWWANADYEEGPLLIRDGDLIRGGNGKLGYLDPIDLYVTGDYPTGDVGTKIFLNRISHTVPDVTLPWVDDEYMEESLETALDQSVDNAIGSHEPSVPNTEAISANPATYATALAPGLPTRVTAHSLAAGSPSSTRYKYVGDGTTMGTLGAGTHDLVIGNTSFGAWEGFGYPLAGNAHDDFWFDVTSGVLCVEGVVFIDGDLTIGQNVRAYTGNGTLVVNGDVAIHSPSFGPSQSDVLSAEEALGIVSPGDVTIGTGPIKSYFHGAVFCNGVAGLYGAGSTNSTRFKGSLLAGNIYGDSPGISIEIDPTLPDVLPSGMPAAGGGMVFAGSWSRN